MNNNDRFPNRVPTEIISVICKYLYIVILLPVITIIGTGSCDLIKI